jgi:hypothetical protein
MSAQYLVSLIVIVVGFVFGLLYPTCVYLARDYDVDDTIEFEETENEYRLTSLYSQLPVIESGTYEKDSRNLSALQGVIFNSGSWPTRIGTIIHSDKSSPHLISIDVGEEGENFLDNAPPAKRRFMYHRVQVEAAPPGLDVIRVSIGNANTHNEYYMYNDINEDGLVNIRFLHRDRKVVGVEILRNFEWMHLVDDEKSFTPIARSSTGEEFRVKFHEGEWRRVN